MLEHVHSPVQVGIGACDPLSYLQRIAGLQQDVQPPRLDLGSRALPWLQYLCCSHSRIVGSGSDGTSACSRPLISWPA
jgi:hypothetical protein